MQNTQPKDLGFGILLYGDFQPITGEQEAKYTAKRLRIWYPFIWRFPANNWGTGCKIHSQKIWDLVSFHMEISSQ